MPENTNDWMSTVTGWADKALGAVIAKKVTQPHELQMQQMQMGYYGGYGGFGALGANGLPVQGTGGISSGVVVLGVGALLLFVLMRD